MRQEFSADKQRLFHVRFDPETLKRLPYGMLAGQVEHGLDIRAIAAMANHFGGASATGRQSQSIDNDRFTCTGLAGQDVKARMKRNGYIFNNCQVVDG
jgi:hypothetical protein